VVVGGGWVKLTMLQVMGIYFSDSIGEYLTIGDLSKRPEVSGNTVRTALHKTGAIDKGAVTDEDLGHYLPDKATVDKQKAALELSASPWR